MSDHQQSPELGSRSSLKTLLSDWHHNDLVHCVFFTPFRYRKVVSNNCTDGVREQYTAKPQKCPGKAPRGLRIITADGKLTAEQGHNVTLMVQLEEVGRVPMAAAAFLLEAVIFPNT